MPRFERLKAQTGSPVLIFRPCTAPSPDPAINMRTPLMVATTGEE